MTCPHCQADAQDRDRFCEQCGKALPAGLVPPRVVLAWHRPATLAGRELQRHFLLLQLRRKTARALLVVVAFAWFGGSWLLAAGVREVPRDVVPAAATFLFGTGALYLALALWARREPLGAAIVGLLTFVTVQLLSALADPNDILRGLLLKVLLLVLLVVGVRAGVRHRRLLGWRAPGLVSPAP